jgi:hypothetical protein
MWLQLSFFCIFDVMKKIKSIYLCLVIGVLISCGNQDNRYYDYNITFKKTKGTATNGTCEVTILWPDGRNQIIDTFACSSDIEGDTILYQDISKLREYGLDYIDSLDMPENNNFGIPVMDKAAIVFRGINEANDKQQIGFNRYTMFKKDGKLTILKDYWEDEGFVSGVEMRSQPAIIYSESPASSEEQKTKQNEAIAPTDKTKSINEIKLSLLDERVTKVELLLGKPDKVGDLGYWSKGYMVYFNKVVDNDGTKKHLVLFIRKKDASTRYTPSFPQFVEEIYAVRHGEKACFGVHCITL